MLPAKFNFFDNPESQTLDVILHGGSQGIESEFIQKVFNNSKEQGNSVISFNFPYYERGEEKSSSPELKEELETLQTFLGFCDYKKYKKVRLIAKSLGGIVASFYLDKLAIKNDKSLDLFSITILGYVVGDVKLKNFGGYITIIQGEKDKFGNIEVVKKDMHSSVSKNINYFEIKNANHSFKNPETDKPDYVDMAIGKIDQQI